MSEANQQGETVKPVDLTPVESTIAINDQNNAIAQNAAGDPLVGTSTDGNIWKWSSAPMPAVGGRRQRSSQKKGGRKSKKCSGGKKSKKQQKGGKRKSQKSPKRGGKKQQKQRPGSPQLEKDY